MTFADKVTVVTGASGTIGKAIALGLATRDAKICLVGRKLAALEAAAKDIQKSGGRAFCYPVDLSVDEELQVLMTHLQRDFDHVDVLVHSAAIIVLGQVEQSSLADFDSQYRVNIRAPYALSQGLLPMLRPCQGQIVFMNSSVWLNARAGIGQYAATKYALKAIADTLRDEVNASGIRVLSVFLGRTAGPMQVAIHGLESKIYDPERLLQPRDIATAVMNALSLPRTAEATDIHIRPLQKPS